MEGKNPVVNEGAIDQATSERPALDAEELANWKAFRDRADQDARDKLITKHYPLVRIIAASVYRSSNFGYVELRDLVQLGTLGLMEAMSTFDPHRGNDFPSFANKRIRGAMLNGLEQVSEFHAQGAFRRRVQRERLDSLNEGASDSRASDVFLHMVDVAVGLAVGRMLEDTAMYVESEEKGVGYSDHAEVFAVSESFRHLVKRLSNAQQRVVTHHYLHGMQFVDIAKLLGLSKGRVSQIHADAMTELRRLHRSLGGLDLKI